MSVVEQPIWLMLQVVQVYVERVLGPEGTHPGAVFAAVIAVTATTQGEDGEVSTTRGSFLSSVCLSLGDSG